MISMSLHHCSSCSKQFILMWCYVYTMCYYPQLIALTGLNSYTITRLTFLTESCCICCVFLVSRFQPCSVCLTKGVFSGQIPTRACLCNLSFQVLMLILLIWSLIWWFKITFFIILWYFLNQTPSLSSPCSLPPPFPVHYFIPLFPLSAFPAPFC